MSHPNVRRRRLGTELRRVREAIPLTLDDVAERTTLTPTKLSRVETARVGIKPPELDSLLDLYAMEDESRRTALHHLARGGSKRGWWYTYRDSISPAYADLISLESEAQSMRSYETTLIPGLLQTAAYARTTLAATNMGMTQDRVNALAEVRIQRQAVLTQPEPLELWAIIHEPALRLRIAAPQVMRDQMQRLVDLSQLPQVSIQILPSDSTPHPGLSGPFAVIGFPETPELDLVLVETLTSTVYVEEPPEVSVYAAAFEKLKAAAMPFDDSADLIARAKEAIT